MKVVHRVAFVFCLIALGVLSLAPNAAPILPGLDKLSHTLAFGALAFTGQMAFDRRTAWLVIGLFSFGAAIEVFQALTPGRFASMADLLANTIGMVLGLAVVRFLSPLGGSVGRSPRRQSSRRRCSE